MEEFQIETAQNVGIHQQVANIGDRILAYLIDSVIVFAYMISMIIILNALDIDMFDSWAIFLLLSLPAFMYYILFETFWDGKTIGKHVVKIKVVKLDGTKPAFSNYLIRWLLRIVDVTISTGGIAVLTILIKGNGQRLGDIAAGTTVITEKTKVSIQETLMQELPDNYVPKYSQVTVFSDTEIQTIKNLYDKAVRNGQHNIILALQKRLKLVMQVEPVEKPVDFVSTVIKDYNYYTQKM
ncbi:RDD family protein [Mangrovimonas spongiae]|uniref:RDD family protein n=1 Tax=Mangrovimonas spongiae TaxID=2494697 RepID=A0A3R9NWG4_9FLAO|nr:RDD family protein [Mangrovimonas spongiae]RSK39136.1 RDD family protein [Mangrovimonas spongiae]